MGRFSVIKHMVIHNNKFPFAPFDLFQPFLHLFLGVNQVGAYTNEIGAVAFGFLPVVSAVLLKMLHYQVFEQETVINVTQCKNPMFVQEAILQYLI